jgi:uncharacterized membrane protein
MMFKGFEKFVPLMVVGLIQAIPGVIFQILRFTVDFAQIMGGRGRSPLGGTFFQSGDPEFGLAQGLSVLMILLGIGFILFSIVWNLVFFFAIPLILEHDLDVIDAIKTSVKGAFSNLGGLIVLMILGGLVGVLGVLALCVGIFVAIPVVYAANAFAYRQVFPMIERNFNMSPPPPTAYGSGFGTGQ